MSTAEHGCACCCHEHEHSHEHEHEHIHEHEHHHDHHHEHHEHEHCCGDACGCGHEHHHHGAAGLKTAVIRPHQAAALLFGCLCTSSPKALPRRLFLLPALPHGWLRRPLGRAARHRARAGASTRTSSCPSPPSAPSPWATWARPWPSWSSTSSARSFEEYGRGPQPREPSRRSWTCAPTRPSCERDGEVVSGGTGGSRAGQRHRGAPGRSACR